MNLLDKGRIERVTGSLSTSMAKSLTGRHIRYNGAVWVVASVYNAGFRGIQVQLSSPVTNELKEVAADQLHTDYLI